MRSPGKRSSAPSPSWVSSFTIGPPFVLRGQLSVGDDRGRANPPDSRWKPVNTPFRRTSQPQMHEEESDNWQQEIQSDGFVRAVDFVKRRATTRARLRSQSPSGGESGLA